jgi:hypothetical protein
MMKQIAMAQPGARVHHWRQWLAWLTWGVLILLAWRFITRDALRYFDLDEATFGRFWPRRMWLLPHIAGGMLALLLGPFQFWSGLRRQEKVNSLSLRVHRWTGRLYLVGVGLAAGSALHLAFFIPPSEGGWAGGVALFTLAAVWLMATALAVVAILNGLINTHQEWMIRSYVLTFAFVNLRSLGDFPIISSAGTVAERLTTVVWLSWTLPLFVTEVNLEWKRTRPGKRLHPSRRSEV